MSLTLDDFNLVRALMRDVTGNQIGDDKSYLVETRLAPLLQRSGHATLSELVEYVRRTRDPEWQRQIVDAMLNGETYFFREPQTLQYLADNILPELLADYRTSPLRLWSAACSTGQEVYSLSLLLSECPGTASRDIHITGSDISSRVLEQARRREYSSLELDRNLPQRFRDRFAPLGPDRWSIRPTAAHTIQFETCNLKSDTLRGPWHVVLLRNVLIYFDEELRQSIFRRVHSQIAPGGWLLLGSSETSRPPDHLFRRAHPGTACFQIQPH